MCGLCQRLDGMYKFVSQYIAFAVDFQTCQEFTGQKDGTNTLPLPNGTGSVRGPPPLHPINPGSLMNARPLGAMNTPRSVASPAGATPRPVRLVNVSSMAQQQSVSGHMITLPPAVLQRLNPQQKLTLLVNQQRIQVPPSMLIHGPDGVKLYLPSGIIPNAPTASTDPARPLTLLTNPKDPQTLTIKQMPAPAATPVVAPPAPPLSPEPVHIIPDEEDNTSEKTPSPKRSVRISQRQFKGINTACCFFQKLHAGYDCMPKIFEYLTVAELLR